ncbi:PPOX class F420-dependent oxidoreductase [Actinomycetospora straminea]|uniref:PPOX class F420-dependent oxidoreductase n=1 Tax=Actinomycetospora straminea TaxID=663607 RepID=A0ABP9F1Y4_9PSEU|nr:PPOX class F420-dependent oxidoreductase [Actinomycetospora straminea]MDD7934825.1 PPOX class F420-dependent oxidoreductase [Actinomycetospora straminea]
MSATTGVTALGDEPFLSLTTHRRDGTPVPTAVWVARDGDSLVVITSATSGKVKRLRRDPRIVLRPCDRAGTVAPDAPTAEGRAEIVDDPAAQAGPRRALAAKYGLQYRLISVLGLVGRLRALVGRAPGERVILRLRD